MRNTCVPLALLLAFACGLDGQSTGRITGAVVDSSGAAVPGAKVQLFFPGGSKAVLSGQTTAEGLFNFASVRPAVYDLTIEATGFVKTTVRGVTVDPARATDLPPVKLELPSVTQSIDVAAGAQGVQTSNAEVSTTITTEQVRRLPLLDRDPLSLVYTQAGVAYSPRSDTVINGQRASYTNMTLDGINIQDNFIRDNGVDYTPNMLLLDQVGEFTISSSNSNASFGGGASQIAFVTPSGTNELHGSTYWYNRNNFFSSNDWFNNQAGVERPQLNQNQLGGSLAGPVRKDRLFFYTNYEAFRLHQQSPANRTILTGDARNGIFTYTDTSGVVRKVNVLTAKNVTADPSIQSLLTQVPGPEKINNFDAGDSRSGALRNTGGYRFNLRDNRIRDNVTAKVDYNLSTKNVFTGTYLWNRDDVDRGDLSNDYSVAPKVTNLNHSNLFSAAWRWTPSARLTNELRGGLNFAPGDFPTSQTFPPYLLSGLVFSDPVNTTQRQGRDARTVNIMDNASYQRGRHNVQFGFQTQRVKVRRWNDDGILPEYTLGMSSGNSAALVAGDLPGARNADVTRANDLLATLGGFITSYQQFFNVTSRTSGFVPGASDTRNYSLNQYAWYIHDQWKVLPRLTVTLGLRYDLFGVPDERDALALTPVVTNNNPLQTLLSNSTLDFAGSAAGRPLYSRDKRNFSPNIALAWDVSGNGSTAVRAGYSINYVNDQTLLATLGLLDYNSGLIGASGDFGLTARLTAPPKVPVPVYQVPRTFADNYADDSTSVFGLVDPHLRTPYVQQWNLAIQQQVKGNVVEIRYVGNHTTRGIRAFDVNQVVIRENGFLDDFIRAQNNGFAAVKAGRAFNPAYNAAIPGSQPLTVFPKLDFGGSLTNGTVRSLIQSGQVGELAATYAIDGENGPVQFFRNPNALAADYLTNYSNATYNSLQVEVRRRLSGGLDFQGNYTFSKVLSDAAGTSQSRIEHFLDSTNPQLERARADFDLTHMIKANAIYEIPLGKGHRLSWGPLNQVLGGWSVSGIMVWQSGAPFSILSSRGTLNRLGGDRSYNNTAVSTLTKGQLDPLLQLRMTGDGPYFIAASAINPQDFTGVAADGEAPFSGQVFSHPGPGQVGTLQRRMFSGPWTFNLDFGAQKQFKLAEKKSLQFRMEGTNILNHPTFSVDDQSLDATDFGKISGTLYGRRVIQFGLYLRF